MMTRPTLSAFGLRFGMVLLGLAVGALLFQSLPADAKGIKKQRNIYYSDEWVIRRDQEDGDRNMDLYLNKILKNSENDQAQHARLLTLQKQRAILGEQIITLSVQANTAAKQQSAASRQARVSGFRMKDIETQLEAVKN